MKTSINKLNRREFIKNTGRIAAASAFAGMAIPYVNAAGSEVIQLALVGCGGRGTGAVHDAFAAKNGPVKLVAMADVFEDRLKGSQNQLKKIGSGYAVTPDTSFIGFDAYKKAMDCLKPGDVVILATPPAFRWVHFSYAIAQGLNVFMEKPVTVDGPTSRRMLQLGEESVEKNLKVGVGLMCRHCRARNALSERIQAGDIGEILLMRAYRMHPAVGSFASVLKPADISEVAYQIRRFHSFIWASGGAFNDFYIHNIDECCWIKGAWPVKARAVGGRHFRGSNVDQNFDNYSVEYTFDDGARLFLEGRVMDNCLTDHSSLAQGTKGLAVISADGHMPSHAAIYKGQKCDDASLAWAFAQPEPNPYHMEWADLLDAIRNNKPYNEVKRGVEASLVASMGRMAAHTGQEITFEMAMNIAELAPGLDKLSLDGPAPLIADANGKYPVPMPGMNGLKEY